MPTIAQQLNDLTVSCRMLVDTIGDLRERGHLKEHPEYIEHAADRVALMLAEVREAVAKERAATDFPPLPAGEAERSHREQVADYVANRNDWD